MGVTYLELAVKSNPTIKRHATDIDSAAPPCQDLVHPRTGISDCPQRKHLCENPIYRQLMAEQCSLTCNKCNPTPTPAGPAPCKLIVEKLD
ncbi:unnamed protein product [Strongylus vulgaris]|uniref:ShKT domain-containing protein n=1 Tax=Strongylus vulgaris TaxID=40348 RepID=A0A3P7LZ05_STRVU|nr:unnamed protein product [Strongylus vulgaris]